MHKFPSTGKACMIAAACGMLDSFCAGGKPLNKANSFVGITCLAFLMTGCNSTHKTTTNTSNPNSAPMSLTGTEWVLQDLAGTPALPNVKATLVFPETGRAAGNASCNRFTGSAEVSGDTIKFGALASTRMACADNAVNSQEMEYLKVLAAAKRFELKDSALLIHAEGYDKPLRFTRATPATP
jgi:heat shock protein HslJ